MTKAALKLIDRRQQVAAANLIAAIDLPQAAHEVSKLWLHAARVAPGITLDQMPATQGRKAGLLHAQTLITEMLAELGD